MYLRIYLFSIFRQDGTVQLKAGLNGGGGGAPDSQWHDQTTVPGATSLNLGEKRVGSLTFSANQYREDAGDWGYGLWSLSEKTRMSNHLSAPLVWTILSPARTKEPKCGNTCYCVDGQIQNCCRVRDERNTSYWSIPIKFYMSKTLNLIQQWTLIFVIFFSKACLIFCLMR